MGLNLGRAAWEIAFQKTPILLTRGIAANIPGGVLPIVALTEAANFVTGLLTGGPNINLDDFFANFEPMPGSALISNQAATYPFANQSIAANAIIAQGLPIPVKMTAPATGKIAYPIKLATMTALKGTLDQHNNLGGTYSVITPSYIYTDCLLLSMRDIGSDTQQKQVVWQLDFFQFLVSLQAAQTALNSLMQKLNSKVPISGSPGALTAAGLPASIPAPLTAIYPPGSTGSGLPSF